MGKVKCPKCGYEPTPGEDVLKVWDRVDVSAKVSFDENGKPESPTWELGEGWDNKDTVVCPECDEESPMQEWGLSWEWESRMRRG